jgi:hypothetical protein
MTTKAAEIYNIFDSNNNGGLVIGDLKQLMMTISPKNTEDKWNKWK